jgi:serine/threonine protein kinase
MHLAMEYIPLGDLETTLQNLEKSNYNYGPRNCVLRESEVKDITTQILEGVKIMHAEGFAHRDLKPQVGYTRS